MQTLFGLDLTTAQKVIVASVVILILLVLLGLFVRQIQGGRLKLKGQGGGRARQPRLGVVDAHNLDRQRQLILIRRDNVEHLIMIGGASDVVVETNIVRSGARAAPPQPMDYSAPERPAAFEPPAPQEPARLDPPRPEPVAVAQPRPDLLPPLPQRQPQAQPPSRPAQPHSPADVAVAAAAAAALPAAAAVAASLAPSTPPSPPVTPQPTPSVQPPSFARDHAPSPTATAFELDSMARHLEEALKRPFSAVRPANSPGEASAAPKQEPEPVRESTPAPAVAPVRPEPMWAPVRKPETPPQEPVAQVESTAKPSSLPSDVEAELEFALGLRPERKDLPSSAPGAAHPAAPSSEPGPDDEVHVAPDPDIIAALEAYDEEFGIADSDTPKPAADKKPEAETETSSSEAQTEPAAVEADVPPAAPAEPKPETKPAAIDPFSVDAIEAEFARLLGRDPKSKS